jgi:hypothetical protein
VTGGAALTAVAGASSADDGTDSDAGPDVACVSGATADTTEASEALALGGAAGSATFGGGIALSVVVSGRGFVVAAVGGAACAPAPELPLGGSIGTPASLDDAPISPPGSSRAGGALDVKRVAMGGAESGTAAADRLGSVRSVNAFLSPRSRDTVPDCFVLDVSTAVRGTAVSGPDAAASVSGAATGGWGCGWAIIAACPIAGPAAGSAASVAAGAAS